MMHIHNRADRKSGTILIIGDEGGVRNVTAFLLVGHGYTVLEAPDVRRALLICADRRGPIDLAIVDIYLPDLNGFEFVSQAKRIRNDFRVIFMSEFINSSRCRNLTETLAEGQNFISRPFSQAHLLSTVDKTLGDQS